MSRLQMMALFMRLIGIFWLFTSSTEFLSVLLSIVMGHSSIPLPSGFVILLVVVLKLLIGLVLCFWPKAVVRFLTPGPIATDEEESTMIAADFQFALFVALGLFFAATALRSLLWPLYSIVVHGLKESDFSNIDSLFQFQIIPLIQLVFGVWLMLGGKGLMGVIHKLRTVGH